MERLDFKALKAKVGVDDIAYSLGYRLDKRAGVGAYIERWFVKGQMGKCKTLSSLKTRSIKMRRCSLEEVVLVEVML